MKITYRQTRGTQPTAPAAVDTTSSPSTVYLRKDIKRITVVDSEGNDTPYWQYDEATLTPEEYKEYLSEIEETSLLLLMQEVNDLKATQELADITAEINHEETMCLLNDIQADILLGADE